MTASGPITLTTDFGTRDGYVAAMKGVMSSLADRMSIVDAAHDLPPGQPAHAAWVLHTFWRRFPPGSIHVVVVDPGVGTHRRALVLDAAGHRFVGPDNGVFHYVLAEEPQARVHEAREAKFRLPDVSRTFHGRDVFAPAAAWLARGVDPGKLGPAVDDPVRLDLPEPSRSADELRGVVTCVDHFGNLVTNLPGAWLDRGESLVVRAGGADIRLRATYGDAAPGDLLALVGSAATLEVSVAGGSAAGRLELGLGDEVRVGRLDQAD